MQKDANLEVSKDVDAKHIKGSYQGLICGSLQPRGRLVSGALQLKNGVESKTSSNKSLLLMSKSVLQQSIGPQEELAILDTALVHAP